MPFEFSFSPRSLSLALTYKHTLCKNNKTVITFTSSLSYYCLFDLSLVRDNDCVRKENWTYVQRGNRRGITKVFIEYSLCSSCQRLIRIENKHSGIEKCMVKYTNHQKDEKVNYFNCYYKNIELFDKKMMRTKRKHHPMTI